MIAMGGVGFEPPPAAPSEADDLRDDLADRSPPPVKTRTCRVCKTSYDPGANDDRACRHHPGVLRGESARKSDWEDGWKADGKNGGELVWTWNCCGGGADSPGCVFDRHRSYDD